GLDGPDKVACLSLRYQIAQKLHAVTERPPDRPNLRFWDLIDLILLRDIAGDFDRVREAAEQIFAGRDTHEWPPRLVVPDAWGEPYARSAAEIDGELPATIEGAADLIRAFIAEIADAA